VVAVALAGVVTAPAGSGYPAGERLVPAVVRWLEEHGLPELGVAVVTGDQDVTHTAAAAGSFGGRFTQARLPAHLRLAGPQLVTEWAVLGLVLEHGDGHRRLGVTAAYRMVCRRSPAGQASSSWVTRSEQMKAF
jgi:hypothetical protein